MYSCLGYYLNVVGGLRALITWSAILAGVTHARQVEEQGPDER
jgi:hypothetical protein